MAWLALLLYLLGLLLAFGWRTVARWRRAGDTGLRLDAGPPGTLRWWAKLLFIAALVLGFAGPAAALAGLPQLPGLDHRPMHVVGLVVAVAGIAATLAAQLAMGTSWRVGVGPAERTHLVTSGPFALARNTFAGIAPTSIPGFVVAQLVGLAVGVGLLAALDPDAGQAADQVVVPDEERDPALGTTANDR